MTNWLKILHTFPRNPKIRRLASALKVPKLLAQGLAMQWLIFIDEQTTDGKTGLTAEELDDELGHRGAVKGLCAIGWAVEAPDGTIHALEYEKHCGETAKKRSEDNRRKVAQRERDAEKKTRHAKAVTDVTQNRGTEEEEEFNNISRACTSMEVDGGGGTQNPPDARQARAGSGPDGAYRAWVGELAPCHPTLDECRVLPEDVDTAARAAFKRRPDATRHAALLHAYLRDRRDKDAKGRTFFRPLMGSMFFKSLERTITDAKKWAKMTGWKSPAEKRAEKPLEAPATAGAGNDTMSDAEVASAFSQIRKEANLQ